MSIEVVNLFVLVQGAVAVCLMGWVTWRFYSIRDESGLSRAIAGSAGAGFVAMAMTMLFAVTSYIGVYFSLTPERIALMRVVIFTTTIAAEVHLLRKMRAIERG